MMKIVCGEKWYYCDVCHTLWANKKIDLTNGKTILICEECYKENIKLIERGVMNG